MMHVLKDSIVQYIIHFPKSIPQKIFKIFLLNFSTLSLLIFQCLKLAIAQVLFFLEVFASALLFTFVENELSLEP